MSDEKAFYRALQARKARSEPLPAKTERLLREFLESPSTETTTQPSWFSDFFDKAYLEGWVLATTFGAVDQWLAGNRLPSIGCALVGAVLQSMVARWSWVKAHAPVRFMATLHGITTDARWWIVTLMVFLGYVALSPYVAQHWFPFSYSESRSAVGIAELPTKLRVLFHRGQKPETLESKNLTWTWMIPTEYLKNPNYTSPGQSTAPPSILGAPRAGITGLGLPEPEYHEVNTWMMILVFDQPISYKKISINNHGAILPKPEIWQREKWAIIWFHEDIPDGTLIDFEATNND